MSKRHEMRRQQRAEKRGRVSPTVPYRSLSASFKTNEISAVDEEFSRFVGECLRDHEDEFFDLADMKPGERAESRHAVPITIRWRWPELEDLVLLTDRSIKSITTVTLLRQEYDYFVRRDGAVPSLADTSVRSPDGPTLSVGAY